MLVISLLLKIIVIVSVAVGLAIQLRQYPSKNKLNLFRYFTDQSNLLIALLMTAGIVLGIESGKWYFYDSELMYVIKFMAVSAITVTHVTFAYVLRPVIIADNKQKQRLNYNPDSFEDILLHYVAPITAVFEFLVTENHTYMQWWMPLLCIIYPLVYFIVSLLLGLFGKPFTATDGERVRFPYFFINPDIVGWKGGGSANSKLGVVHFVAIFVVTVLVLSFAVMGLAYSELWLYSVFAG